MTQRIAVVTGGMGGIGHAICRALSEKGIRVVAGYSRTHEDALAWQEEEKKAGFPIEIAYADVSNFDSCATMIQSIEATFGSVDILINNAGITRDHACCKMDPNDWDVVIATDLSSVFYLTRAVINGMKTRQFGRIINVSSINGQKGQYGQVNYAAAKAGMHGFTKALALEVAKHGISVNTISPGYVATSMVMAVPEDIRKKIIAEIPMGRFAEPEEVAHVVAFLVDEKSGYITGTNIAINGGHYMV